MPILGRVLPPAADRRPHPHLPEWRKRWVSVPATAASLPPPWPWAATPHGPGYNESQANATNSSGQIVGFSIFARSGSAPFIPVDHAFLYQHGTMTYLGTLDKSGLGISQA